MVVGTVVEVVVGTVICEATACSDCFAMVDEPFTLVSPFLTSGGWGCDGVESMGSSGWEERLCSGVMLVITGFAAVGRAVAAGCTGACG